MLFDKYCYVAVEGQIGAGKTSLARRLAQYGGTAALLEKPDKNLFLVRFYQYPPHPATGGARAKPYEQTISDDYLLRVAQDYSDFFYHYDAADSEHRIPEL